MLRNTLVTIQNPQGIQVNTLFVVEKVNVVAEKYLSITLDRKHQCPVIIGSSEGGVNIEDTARDNPDAIKILPIDIMSGLNDQETRKFAESIGYTGHLVDQAVSCIKCLYETFRKKDCLMIEINPLATVNNTGKEEVMVIDSKVSIDDNAAFRQKDIESIIDTSGKNEIEKEAESYGLNFIRLDGSIGCLVNGAGLAMATMDIIKLHGGSPANFLDVGGGADMDGMIEALRVLNQDSQVESILINIFGGILRCDVLVQAIIQGTEKYNLKKPIVLRLKGTNSEIASELISKSNIPHIRFCNDLDKATRMVLNKNI
jgi:succinyl-CoA synthetase beta subunit